MRNMRQKIRGFVACYLLVWFVGSFWALAAIKSGTFHHFLGVDLEPVKEYAYYACAGAIGGTLYAVRLFHDYYYRINIRWLYWYTVRPFLCAGAAMMTIVLFQSGIMLLEVGGTLYAKIGVAFLVGYGYGKFMDKLKTLTEALFNGKPEKPPVSKNDNGPGDN